MHTYTVKLEFERYAHIPWEVLYSRQKPVADLLVTDSEQLHFRQVIISAWWKTNICMAAECIEHYPPDCRVKRCLFTGSRVKSTCFKHYSPGCPLNKLNSSQSLCAAGFEILCPVHNTMWTFVYATAYVTTSWLWNVQGRRHGDVYSNFINSFYMHHTRPRPLNTTPLSQEIFTLQDIYLIH